MTKASFKEATSLKNFWNSITTWNGYTLATVKWHEDREWKIVESNATFDEVAKRDYKPIAEFHTQEELWQYIKANA